MGHWSLEDIPWQAFDHRRVQPELVSLAKAACMVEHNSADYARYLCDVFPDDPIFQEAAHAWAEEEIQHGQALRKWTELADPDFDFERSFAIFTTGYHIPSGVRHSIRGSRTGELLARCVVEAGTSSYYTALKDATEEPVLKTICACIAADEFRHYKLFYTHMQRYLASENIGLTKRFLVALGRIVESEDDELAYAYFAAHTLQPCGYNRRFHAGQYLAGACHLYRRGHIEKMMAMVLKAVGLKPHGRFQQALNHLAWGFMRLRRYTLRPL